MLLFNLGVLAPFVLSFFILLSASQNCACPSMVAGLTFIPLFVLFMVMAAVQMPVSVTLADACLNTTGAIDTQLAGRVSARRPHWTAAAALCCLSRTVHSHCVS